MLSAIRFATAATLILLFPKLSAALNGTPSVPSSHLENVSSDAGTGSPFYVPETGMSRLRACRAARARKMKAPDKACHLVEPSLAVGAKQRAQGSGTISCRG